MMWKEIRRRLGEAASLVSCGLNIVVGTGDREITLSAGAFELRRGGALRGRWMVPLIDAMPWNTAGHCEEAWEGHQLVWMKVASDRVSADGG